MELFFSQILNGLAIGQVYVLIALGFSLVFGVSNVINFAQGALFMLGAFLAYTALVIWSWPLWLASVFSVIAVTILGLVLERIAIRPLAKASYVAPLLSTLAISIIVDQLAELIWSPETQAFPSILSEKTFFIGRAYITMADLLILASGGVAVSLLTWFLHGSWTGKALRAAAQDVDAAAQMGIQPHTMQRIAFGIAGALGALSGILVALYFRSVFPQMGFPFGLKGFSAALLGGLSSIPGAAVGGLLLGVVETLASAYLSESYRDIAAYALLLLVLLVHPQGMLGGSRSSAFGALARSGAVPTTSLLAPTTSQRLQHRVLALTPARLFLAVLVAGAAGLLTGSDYVIHACTYGLIFALFAVSTTLVAGGIGVLALGQTIFFGTGAYAVAILARPYNLPEELLLLIALSSGALVGVLCSLPLRKLTGHTVALATLAIGQLGYLIFLNWVTLTRGPMGIANIPEPYFWLFDGWTASSVVQQHWVVVLVSAGAIALADVLSRSNLGRAWRGIREDRIAAHAAGLPVGRHISLAFAVSGALAALAGACFAFVQTVVSPESFTVETAILALTMAVLGGLGNITGAALAGFVLTLLPELLRGLADWRMVIYGLLLLAVLRWRPQGLLGAR